MFVKRLRVAGFKSFADPTILEFEPGVNVIVGPNGSGKSNIADALAWVLGSQAPSSLRGGSMEDVIFAGSEGRPRLGMAEVELTLDNSARILPLDLSEVTISRVTDRAGSSEYRINGAVCRLLDIAELLSDTGIGRSLHTLVGQGELDEILHARPEDRRAFIEEAAQIGKFRRRKDRSLRKIERVEENLTRLHDMLAELTRAIRPLKRQASAAAMYSELVGEYRELKQMLTATELHRLQDEESVLDPERDSQRQRLLGDELANVTSRLETVAGEREAVAQVAEQAQHIAHGIARGADRLNSLGRLAQERSALIAARLAAETEEGYRERIRLLEADIQRWQGQAAELGRVADARRGKASEAKAALALARTKTEAAEQTLAHARGRETEAAQALVRAEGSEAAGRATVGSLEARVHAVLERREVTEHELAADGEKLAAAETDVRALERDLDAATEAAAAAETRLEQARSHADGLKEALGATHAGRCAAEARLEALEEVTGLFADRADVRARLQPLLADARARAAVAGTNEQEAARVLADAETVAERHWSEVARHDEELKRLDALMAGAAERLAGSHRRREAREIALAAQDDELARLRDAVANAERALTEERAALPARRAALEEARDARSDAELVLADCRRQGEVAARLAEETEVEARAVEERSLAAQLRLEEAEAGIADAQAALAGLEGLRTSLRAAQQRAAEVADAAGLAAARASTWGEQAQNRATEARNASHAAEQRLLSLRARERELEHGLEELARRRNAVEVRRAETRARRDALAERAMEEWGLSIDALLELEPLNDDGETVARERIAELDKQMRRMGPVNPRAAEEYAELAERETFLKEQIDDLKRSKQDLMRIVREVDDQIVRVFGEAYEDVAREFEGVFDRLFPGGEGRLTLIDPGDVLASGIDIEARPPGKRVKKLSLLSGGERSLVALAFLFAIFRARPSPFYLLDEVEAALDDVNLHRFLTLIEELERRAQVLVVTHQKRTMEAADVLYGVSMRKDGVSNIVAKRMTEATL